MAIADEILKLESILNSGASQVRVDGELVQYDLAEVRKRLAELRAQQAGTTAPRGFGIRRSRVKLPNALGF
jgi:hypothetical protein